MNSGQTVFVGMSGGVDSSVAALRLKKQGYNVVGVFIKVWHPDFMVCNWKQERLDAMRVAAHLEIPFLTCDAEKAYRDEVAHYFISEYEHGRTPNPDVMCNQKVKFGAFLSFAKQHGADCIATGHYVQKETRDGTPTLKRGADENKDQSYFLWSLTAEQLTFSMFPVGDTSKDKIRAEATKANIPVAEKDDSQGVCFLGHVDIPEFLSHYLELTAGDVLNTNGERIGTHQGAFVYTLGQRHGFTIETVNASRTPFYVIEKNISDNTITVATHKPHISPSEKITLTSLVLRHTIEEGMNLSAQFRYRQEPVSVVIKNVDDLSIQLSVESDSDKPSIGQSCVFYQDDICLGGGIVT